MLIRTNRNPGKEVEGARLFAYQRLAVFARKVLNFDNSWSPEPVPSAPMEVAKPDNSISNGDVETPRTIKARKFAGGFPLNIAKINALITEKEFDIDDKALGVALSCTPHSVHSLRTNGRSHGLPLIKKLAKYLECKEYELYDDNSPA